MRKVINIKFKAEPDKRHISAKAIAVKELKEYFPIGLKDALDLVNQLISDGEIDLNVSGLITGGGLLNKDPQDVGRILVTIFDAEFIDDETPRYHYEEPKLDSETASALEWYNSLTEGEKRRIDLIGRWQNPVCSAGGAAFGGLNMSFD